METRAHHVVIGLFTVAITVAALLFALWISRSSSDREYETYRILFERSVSGLSTGSKVQYSGIEVGEVTQLELAPDDPRQVIARIRVGSGTPIKEDTRARLAYANITGSMTVQLHGGTPESPPLTSSNDEPPLIIADPSPLATLFDEGGDIINNINTILENINDLFNDQNAKQAGNILANLSDITDMVVAQQEALDTNMKLFSELSREATRTVTSVNELTHSVQHLLEQEGEAAFRNASQASSSLANAARHVDRLVTDNASAIEVGLQGTRDIAPALEELRATLSNLNRITRRLEENPRDFLLGGDRIEEFRP
ncbi:MlaD family protein [Halomonas sp. Bachu 37]|uniref:MlaD family protein n=1 Tax=Halomonas kashgarensis TaxID=3084920 RepID=UPI003217322F